MRRDRPGPGFRPATPPVGDPDGGLDEELRFHLEELERDLIAEGRTAAEARREAARRFGRVGKVRRAVRRVNATGKGRGAMGVLMEWIRRDASYALRQAARRPLVAGLTVGTLALGVGATAVVHAVVDAVVLQPVPFERPEGLVAVVQVTPDGRRFSVSEPNYVDFAERQRSFSAMGGRIWATATLTGDGDAEGVEVARLGHRMFELAGVEVLAGRTFRPEEDRAGGVTDVVVLSEGAWTRRYGGDPDVVGRRVVLDGRPRTVVGVVASGRAWPRADLFMPLAADPDGERDNQMVEVVARLAPGVTIEEARADLEAVAADLAGAYPATNADWGADVMPLAERLVGGSAVRLGRLLLAAVGLLLVMACVSASNLQVARASGRVREMSLRAAIGAGRGRLGFQLAVESVLVGSAGGALGLALAAAALPAVQRLGPATVDGLARAALDAGVLAGAVVAAVAAALVSGVAPAALLLRRASAQGPVARDGGRSGEGGARLRGGLVAVQFALALLVVGAAALVARSFVELQRADLGFEPDGLLAFTIRLPDARFGRPERTAFVARLQAELAGRPGVVAVGATSAQPFGRWRPSNFLAATEFEPDRQEDFVPVSWRAVQGDYFEAAGIDLIRGRPLGPSDWDPAGPPFGVVLDAVAAARLFPDGSDPVGRSVTWFMPGGMQLPVVGVVAAAKDETVSEDPRPRVYVPFAFAPWEEPALLVRTRGDAAAFVPAARAAVAALDADVPVLNAAPVARDIRATVAWPRFIAQVLAVFGGICLLLAALGIYGVAAFGVERRRRELGVRVALGARPGGLVALVLRRTLTLAVAGVAVGLVLALAFGRLLEGMLYGVAPADVPTLVGVVTILLVVAVAAVLVPARRAVATDPRETLAT